MAAPPAERARPAFAGEIAARFPDRPAVVFVDTGEQMTYAELDDRANRLARVFHERDLRPGDPVAMMIDNGPDHLAVACGAQYAGLRYVELNTRWKADEVAYVLADSGSRCVLFSARHREVVTAATRHGGDGPVTLVQVGGTVPGAPGASYRDLIAAADPAPLPDRREGRAMFYSSGTTGRPKGVRFPVGGRPLGTPDLVMRLLHERFDLDDGAVLLSPAPLYHGAPHKFCMSALGFGATVLLQSRFDPVALLAAIERHRATHVQLVPTHFTRLLKLPAEVRDAYDLSSLRVAAHSAAPCPVDVKRAMIDWWGPVVREYYSGTEGLGMTYCTSQEWLAHPGTVGRPVFGELHVCDEAGVEVPAGTDGVVYFGGAATFRYHNDDAKTAESRHPLRADWATLGDIGHVDADGYLHLTDRRSYVIISGGVNIYPQEAENLLAGHPDVRDVAVFGIPDPEMGEQVKAVVQPADPARAGAELERELIAWCRERLAHYKCPRSVDFRADLPREPTGKLRKRLIRDAYLNNDSSEEQQ